jgi:hypothetical protein
MRPPGYGLGTLAGTVAGQGTHAPGVNEAARDEAKTRPRELPTRYQAPERVRNYMAGPSTAAKFERYQVISGLAGTGAVMALVGTFSGEPDVIDLLAVGGDAQVQLRNRLGQPEGQFRLVANVPYPTMISRESVWAFNQSDAAPATIIATGKWALLEERAEGKIEVKEEDSTPGLYGEQPY